MQETSATLGTSVYAACSGTCGGVGGRRTDRWCWLWHPIIASQMWRGWMRWFHVVLKRLEPRVTFVTLWALDEVVGRYSRSANTSSSSANIVSSRSWGYGFTHAGSGQWYCEQTPMSVPFSGDHTFVIWRDAWRLIKDVLHERHSHRYNNYPIRYTGLLLASRAICKSKNQSISRSVMWCHILLSPVNEGKSPSTPKHIFWLSWSSSFCTSHRH